MHDYPIQTLNTNVFKPGVRWPHSWFLKIVCYVDICLLPFSPPLPPGHASPSSPLLLSKTAIEIHSTIQDVTWSCVRSGIWWTILWTTTTTTTTYLCPLYAIHSHVPALSYSPM